MGASTDPRPSLSTAPLRSGNLSGRLRENQRQYDIAGIILLTKEDQAMNLEELRSKSSAEIRDIYNGLVDKQIKRFADRVDAERRTAERLAEAGKWDGPLPGSKGAKAAKKAPAAAKSAPKGKGKASPAPAPKAAAEAGGKAGKPAKGTKQKAVRVAKAPAKAKPVDKVGAPRTNLLYIATRTERRMNEGSARTKVYNFITVAGAKGIDREALENHFMNDETVNVKASLDYLVKMDMLKTKDAK
jgi:hypothetical protein